MIDNKLFLDECFKNFFDSLIDNLCFVLKTTDFAEVDNIFAIKEARKISFADTSKNFIKFYNKELQPKSKISKDIDSKEKHRIERALDQLINETTDQLDNIVRKLYNNNNSDEDKQAIKQAVFNNVMTGVINYFEENKFLKNSKLKMQFNRSEKIAASRL